MKNFELKNIEGDEIDNFISTIEKSFDIKFENDELINIRTIGEFCEVIKLKTKGHFQDCTSQQAFYKLKSAINSAISYNKTLTTTTLLSDILPYKNRIKTVKILEQQLGFKLNILTSKGWIILSLSLLFIIGIVFLFFNRWQGIGLITVSVLSLHIAFKTGKELTLETFGELANHIKTNNYSLSRRNPQTYNHNEIESVVIDILIDITAFTKEELAKISA